MLSIAETILKDINHGMYVRKGTVNYQYVYIH